MTRLSLLILFCSWISNFLGAQIPMGQWRTHLPYQYCEKVEVAGSKVWCSSTGGLFYYGLEDNALETVSKVDGLSDNGVSVMRWSQELETLILAYTNSNLDIIRGNQILNLPDILKKQIPGDKRINDIYFLGTKAYLSTGFGIVVLNLEKDEISETYYIGPNGNALQINQVTSDGTWLYAATEQGIRRGRLDDPFLVDFNVWELLSDIPHADGEFSCIAWYEGTLFASYRDPAGLQDEVYYDQGEGWIEYPYFTGTRCLEILDQESCLSLVDDSTVNLINSSLLIFKQTEGNKPRSAALDPGGALWIADYGGGLITDQDGNKWSMRPNGPRSSSVFDIETSQGVVQVIQGGVSAIWGNLWKPALMQTFSNNQWDYSRTGLAKDLVDLVIDPSDPFHVFAGSWGYGLVEFQGQEEKVYNTSNSTLQSIIPGGDFIRVGGLDYDAEGNLWMSNSNVSEPISVLKADGTWLSFRVDNLLTDFNSLGDLLVTRSGHPWVIVAKGNGLFAMDHQGTIDDASDDTYRKVSVVDKFGKVITNDVRSFAEDLDGNLWLGTNQGILVMYSPSRLFTEGSLTSQQILIPRNDGSPYADPLLGTQVVTTIEVDGANRKWLGTAGGGVYLVSDDGQTEYAHFTSANSPLLSDNITDISVDGESGEVYIGTDKGLISYKGEALDGNLFYNQVLVYPNPVREDYEGPVAIKGLLANTTVKISDMSGNLVFETESLGGQAIWDGTNYRGERVATGVYTVFLSSPDGTKSHVTKLLFIH